MCAVLGHHKRLRLGKIKRPDGRRNRCRVSGATTRRSLCNLQAGDRRCGRDCRRPRKGLFPGCPFCPPAGFFDRSRKLRVRRRLFTQPVARQCGTCCCSNCSAPGGAPTPPPAPPARHSHGASCRFVPASAALSLASAAFCAISRSMLACKIATDVLSPVASAA